MNNNIDFLLRHINSIPKIGDKTAAFFSKINITRIKDLFFHFPSNLIAIKLFPDLKKISKGEQVVIEVEIHSFDRKPSKFNIRKPYIIYCSSNSVLIELVYYNYFPEYLLRELVPGSKKIVMGKIDFFAGKIQIAHPDFVINKNSNKSLPQHDVIYPATLGLTSKQIRSYILYALDQVSEIDEWIDEEVKLKNNWPSFIESLKKIHNPKSVEEIGLNTSEKRRLAYDEFLAQQLAINIMRRNKHDLVGRKFAFNGYLSSQLLNRLKFNLTEGQEKALNEISFDQKSEKKMIRLIQGDVGCGKTLVALCSILNVIESNPKIQACIMAPTDVLANQHYKWFSEVLLQSEISIGLLTGKITGKKRQTILNQLKDGNINILIGTHAIFQENVEFADLGLIIIDEQHRFGVEQRASLTLKGNMADILFMTATPIPRTLTLALYGDMDISRITDKPSGRLPIITSMISISKIADIIHSLHQKIKEDSRIYWICPLVEGNEDDLYTHNAAAEVRYQEFKKIFGDIVSMVHGKMKASEKELAINQFAEGRSKILVATTVIEVGINVPEANIIIIEQAEKFGLAQLHQLRGRVGRGEKQSYCILLYSKFLSETSYKRIKALKESNDGFKLADEDLKLRGSGNIVGTKQSGFPEFKIANFVEHYDLLLEANHDAKKIIEHDPDLSSDRGLKLKNLLKLFDLKFDNFRK